MVSMLVGVSGKFWFATFKSSYLTLKRHTKFELVQSWPVVQPLLSLMAPKLKRNCKEHSGTLLICKDKRRKGEQFLC